MHTYDRYRDDDPHRKEEFLWAKYVLAPGESILFCAKPRLRHLLKPADAFIIPFAVAWVSFLTFVGYHLIIRSDSLRPEMLALLPFVVVGFYLTVGIYGGRILRRLRTQYVITTQRILCRRSGKIKSRLYSRETEFQVKVYRDGTGDLHLCRELTNGSADVFCLESVPDIKRAYNLLTMQMA